MIYLLRGIYDIAVELIRPHPHPEALQTGSWWFATQDAIDWGPALATVAEHHGDDDDGEPYPADTGSTRPRCTECGGPNFSPVNELCLACRLGMSP